MRNFTNLVGKKFGKLTVLSLEKEVEKTNKYHPSFYFRYYLCECDCGKKCIKEAKYIASKKFIQNCGCLSKEKRKNKYIDFLEKNPNIKEIRKIFQKMKERCYNKRAINYKNYGGRGIVICDEWLKDNMSFYVWAIKNGYKKGLSIDRIDCNGNYEPSNCRWATKKEQNRNKRTNVFIECNGKCLCVAEWAEIFGITEKLLWQKIHRDKQKIEDIAKKIDR